MESIEKKLRPIGTIAQVHGPVVDITCAVLPPLHQALVSPTDHETYTFEVHQHLDETHVRAITLHRTAGLRRGAALTFVSNLLPSRIEVASQCPTPRSRRSSITAIDAASEF